MNEEQDNSQVPDSFYYQLAFKASADFGVSIAVPAIVAALLGKSLDEKWETEPMMLALLLIVAFVITIIFVIRKAYYYADLYQNGPKNK